MVISDKYKFAFIHIPKCAGSSVRRANEYEEDPFWDRKFYDHPKLGKLHFTHLPLCILETYYPDTYERVLDYESFAIVREPMERFRSAVTQYCKTIEGYKSQDVSPELVRDTALQIIDYLQENPRSLDWRYIHFMPQSEYIYLRGIRVVKHVDKISEFRYLNKFLLDNGLNCVDAAPAENVNVQPTNIVIKKLFGGLHSLCAQHMSNRLKSKLKKPLLNIGILSRDGISVNLLDDKNIVSFVNEYYKHDFVIFGDPDSLSF